MVKKLVLLLLASMLSVWAMSQSVTPQVLASAGNFFTNAQAGASLSFTFGEIALVQTFSNQNYHLTQGFQQPNFNLVGLEDEQFVELFEVFPNPASDFLNVRYQLRHPGLVTLRLFSLNGVEVMPLYEDRYGSGLREEAFDIQGIAQGMYFLRVEYKAPGKGIDHISHFKINVINP